MDIRQITAHFFAAPQISPEDMPEIAASGITRIICNRPDAEIPPSHHANVMAQAAQAANLEFYAVPLTHQSMTPDVIQQNWDLISESDGPVLSYCASGTRSTIAWAIGAASTQPIDEILTAAARGGYDLTNLRPTLDAVAALGQNET